MDSKELNLDKLLQLYKDNENEINDFNNNIDMYKNKINNFHYELDEEFTIEKMINRYKLEFDKDSVIYKNYTDIENKNHYRFNPSYNKIIDIENIKTFDFTNIKNLIKRLCDNNLIVLFSEDKGRFGNELELQDVD